MTIGGFFILRRAPLHLRARPVGLAYILSLRMSKPLGPPGALICKWFPLRFSGPCLPSAWGKRFSAVSSCLMSSYMETRGADCATASSAVPGARPISDCPQLPPSLSHTQRHTCTDSDTHTLTYILIYSYILSHKDILTLMHTSICIFSHPCSHTYVQPFTCTHRLTRSYAHISSHTQTHIHTISWTHSTHS